MSAWETVALKEVAQIERTGVNPSDLPPDTYYLGLEHIARGGEIVGSSTIQQAALASLKFQFNEEHILYGKLRPNLGKIAAPERSGICSTDILPIKPGPKIDRIYLLHLLRQPSMISFATSQASGANLPRLNPNSLGAFTLPLPPMETQRRISWILDEAEAIRAKRRAQLVHFAELERAAFEDRFAGAAWDPLSLGESATDMTIGLVRPGTETGPDFAHQYMKMDGITSSGRLDRTKFTFTDASSAELSRYSARDGDLVFNTRNSRELVGKTAVFRGEPALFNNNLMRIRFDSRLLPDYVHAYLWSSAGQAALERIKSGTTSVFAIYAKDLAKLPIPTPPIAIQRDFAASLAAIRAERDRVAKALEADEELFAALQHRAFRGEL